MRGVIFSPSCDEAAEALGGYAAIDQSLEAFWDAIMRNPYGFPAIESDWFRARYILTKQIGSTPALVWIFAIDANNSVVFHHVELRADD